MTARDALAARLEKLLNYDNWRCVHGWGEGWEALMLTDILDAAQPVLDGLESQMQHLRTWLENHIETSGGCYEAADAYREVLSELDTPNDTETPR